MFRELSECFWAESVTCRVWFIVPGPWSREEDKELKTNPKKASLLKKFGAVEVKDRLEFLNLRKWFFTHTKSEFVNILLSTVNL